MPQALDLKSETATAIAAPSRALGGTPSIASPLRWVRVPTIGHAPAARGFHSAVASPNGGTNLFVAFGCDEVEAQCFNDAYMLDTTNPNGMRWLRLPVGLARPHPRHMASMWVRSASLIVSGGCTPSSASATRGEKCYADLWALNLDGLIQGGKHLNSSHVTFKEEDPHNIGKLGYEVSGRMMKALPAGSSTRKVVEGATSLQVVASSGGSPLNGTNATDLLSNATNATDVNTTTASPSSPSPDTPELMIDSGMDTVTAPQLPTTNEAACQYVNLSRCEQSAVSSLAHAGSPMLLLSDTTKFKLGRYIRINPGAINEEDSRIVGFGRRLEPDEMRLLSGAKSRDAAENAKEDEEGAMKEEGAAAATTPHPPSRERSAAAMAFVQLASRALLPQSLTTLSTSGSGSEEGSSESSSTGKSSTTSSRFSFSSFKNLRQRVANRGRTIPKVELAVTKKEDADDDDGLPHDATDRVHGRALHHQIDLEQTLRFAHHGGERVIMLPESTTKIRAAPAMLHSGARDFLVHRQYELAPPPSPPEETAAERRARLTPKPSPPPSPPAPPGAPPPERAGFIAEDVGYRYGDEELEEMSKTGELTPAQLRRQRARQMLRDAAQQVPVAWLVGAGAVLCFLCMACCAVCIRAGQKKRRRRAKLEDVQEVFHTETWRKLE